MNQVGLIIVAGGRGDRFGADEEKTLAPLLGHPVLAWSLLAFEPFEQITDRVLVVPPGRESLFTERVLEPLNLTDRVAVVPGGEHRQQSVSNGIPAMGGVPHWILVHDGARPLVSRELIQRILDTLDSGESVVPALPLRDSIARVGFETWLKGYVDRRELLAVQTPQGFHRPVLEYAHKKAEQDHFIGTDEASLVLRMNHPVSWIEGEVENLKITYPGDLHLAEAILRNRGYREHPPE